MSPESYRLGLLALYLLAIPACAPPSAVRTGPVHGTARTRSEARPPQLCFVAEERGELRTTRLCLGSLDGADRRFVLRSHQTVPDASFTRMLAGVFERRGSRLVLRPERSSSGTTNHQRGVHRDQATKDRQPREVTIEAAGKRLRLKQKGRADVVLEREPGHRGAGGA